MRKKEWWKVQERVKIIITFEQKINGFLKIIISFVVRQGVTLKEKIYLKISPDIYMCSVLYCIFIALYLLCT